MAPPVANSQGVVDLSFPLQLPPGRQGMEPELAIAYNSESPSGWLGQGWDLSVPAIEVDPRWGVPRYDDATETESYLLNGAQLYPLAHRGPERERSAEQVFHPRIERAFSRIIRHGDAPYNYWWEVTATDGVRFCYGGTPEDGFLAAACLRGDDGNIVRWGLVEVRDINGNFVSYDYRTVTDNGQANSSVAGREMYLREIRYTGHGTEEGPFRVSFRHDRDLGEDRRPDVRIDATLGFKQVAADLLRRVEVFYGDELVRVFRLDYATGAFNVSLLAAITEEDALGADFYTHTFDYYDDVRVDGQYRPFAGQETWQAPDDNIKGGIVNPIPGMDGETSSLGGSNSSNFSAGAAATVGFNDFNLVSKDKTAGGTYAYGSSNDEGLVALVDINGDGLVDKVFRQDDALWYRPNLLAAGTTGFGQRRPIHGISQFSTAKTTSNSYGFEGNPPFSYVGYEYTNATTTTETYFTDFNGDGLLDIARNSRVWFNHLDENGDPVFTTSSNDTPSPILPGAALDGDLITIDSAEIEERIDLYPLHDVVRLWRAPYDGTVSIHGGVSLASVGTPAATAYGQQDGVRVAIQLGGTELWSTTLAGDDGATYDPVGVANIAVEAGDRLYFRVQSIYDGAYDQVNWTPEVTYSDIPEDRLDANALPLYRYEAAEDFVISSEQQLGLPLNGEVRISGDLHKGVTTDALEVIILRRANGFFTPLLVDSLPADSLVELPIDLTFNGMEEDELYFLLRTDTQIDWTAISWMPNVQYISSPDATVIDGDGNPLFSFCPAVDARMYNQAWRATVPVLAPDTLAYTFAPQLDFAGGVDLNDAYVTFSVKSDSLVLGKTTFPAADWAAVEPLLIRADTDSRLFVEYHFRDWEVGQAVQEARFRWRDSAAVSQDTVFEAGYFSVIDPEEAIFGPLYRGWGQFTYNGNRERANQPIDESLLMVEEDAEAPEDIGDDPDNLDGFYDPTSSIFLVMVADAKTQSWLGYDDLTYLTGSLISSSRLGEDAIVPALPSLSGTGLSAPNRITKVSEHSIAGGLGFSVVTGTASQTWTTSEIELDVMDFNGDRYPDVVSTSRIQYTNSRGGLSDLSVPHGFDGHHQAKSEATGFTLGGSFVPSRTSNSGEPQGGASNRRSSRAKRRTGKMSRNSKNAGNTAGDAIGISGTFSDDNDWAVHSWVDINGDGLVDKVREDGYAALNYGYRFGPFENWGFPGIQAGVSNDYGGGLGLSLYNGSIAGGLSLTRTDNHTTQALEDVNSDGLPDVVTVGDNVSVRLNTGTGFGPDTPWPGLEQLDDGSATGESINAAFTVCVPIVFIGIKICFNPSSSVGHGVSRQRQQLGDVDGDGFPDYLLSSHDGDLRVKRSTIGRTNLLRAVHNPLGGRFVVDYQTTGNTVEMPFALWTMSRLEVYDGLPSDGDDGAFYTFAYREGKYDRHERAFYGFGEIDVDERGGDDELLRRRQLAYDQSNFYRQGLLLSESWWSPEEVKLREIDYRYELRDVLTGDPLTPAAANSYDGLAFPALVQQQEYFFQGGNELVRTQQYDYDGYGNLVLFTDLGGGTAPEWLQVAMTYHDRPDRYLQASMASLTLSDQQGWLRQRDTELDGSGALAKVTERINEQSAAHYDFTYDAYGNVTSVTRPANIDGDRFFWNITYDEEINTYPVQQVDAYGLMSTFVYDPRFGRQLGATDEQGATTTITLDERGRPLTLLGPLEAADGLEYTFRWEYDPTAEVARRLTQRWDPEQEAPWEEYELLDGIGRSVQTQTWATVADGGAPADQWILSGREGRDDLGHTAVYYLPRTLVAGSGGQWQAQPDAVTPTVITYDLLDRPVELALPDGNRYSIDYDIAEAPDGTPAWRTLLTDPVGNQYAWYTDLRGRRLATVEFGPSGELTTRYTYNAVGELLQVKDVDGHVTSYTYDRLGRLLSLDHPDGGRTDYAYDAAGNLLTKVTPEISALAGEEVAVEYTYEYERLLRIDYPFNPQNQVRYYYGDPEAPDYRAGRIYLQEDGSGAQEYWYNAAGQLTKTLRTLLLNEVQTPTFATSYDYDSWGRLQELIYPDGEVVSYAYDRGGRPTTVQGTKDGRTYDYVLDAWYDKFGQRQQVEYGNGVIQTNTTDPARGWITAQQLRLPGGQLQSDRAYTYDALGHLLTEEERLTPAADSPVRALDQSYVYDELYRIIGATGSWGSADEDKQYNLDWEYDPLYNLLLQAGEWITQQNEEVDTVSTSLLYAYEGDQPHFPTAVGELTYEPTPGGYLSNQMGEEDFRALRWDEEGRLAALLDNGYISRYSYDADGRRAIQSHGPSQGLFIDATPLGTINHAELAYTLYVHPFIEVMRDSFVKHYYLADERIATKGGTGYFADHLLPPGQTVTAGNLDLSDRLRRLREVLVEYVANLGVPPGHPTLPFYYAEAEQTGAPLPGLEEDNDPRFLPPPGWPAPEGPPDPSGPPGHPVWFAEPSTPENVEPGYGYFNPIDRPELDQYFYHYDPLGRVQQVTDAFGKVRQQTVWTPYGQPLADEHLQEPASPQIARLTIADPASGLYYADGQYVDPQTGLQLSWSAADEEMPQRSPYLWQSGNPFATEERDQTLAWVNEQGLVPFVSPAPYAAFSAGNLGEQGAFDLGQAGAAPPVQVPNGGGKKKPSPKANADGHEPESGETVATSNNTGDAPDSGWLGNSNLRAFRTLFFRDKTDKKPEAKEQAAEPPTAQRSEEAVDNRRSSIQGRPRANAITAYDLVPDAKRPRTRRRGNGFKVRFRLPRN
ncbi:MAG: hypothetical protein KDC54_24900 [Lewinella sp.]|nr:hypothetical protein [Lewinella sp.]